MARATLNVRVAEHLGSGQIESLIATLGMGSLLVAFTMKFSDSNLVLGVPKSVQSLREEGVDITMPLREEPWGERAFQVTDPNGVIVQLLDWNAPTGQ